MRSEHAKRVLSLVVGTVFALSAQAGDCADAIPKSVALDACFNQLLDELAVAGTSDTVPGRPHDSVARTDRNRARYMQEPNWSTKIAPAIREVCACYIPPIVAVLAQDSSPAELVRRVRANMLGIDDGPQDERLRFESCYAPLLKVDESLAHPNPD